MSSESPDDAGFGLGLDEPPQPARPPAGGAGAAQPYRVLARKYRPQSFGALIGQDAMVQTLGNAIRRDRLAHAFLLTGVRGVGKTSTARLIAKALNCVGPDGAGGPTIDPCGVCEPCRAIAEGRHIDVVEMDAASHTGVDDVREIIEAVRYAAVSARYKVYIVDEVHMLSKNAFNALLKTLEEPPAHVKFLFATTEVNKMPVTVLSRCQRFDLRRIPAEALAAHFGEVARLEGVEVEPEALALIARAAEGSARDGLSILDQAIAHGAGGVAAGQVRAMLGLSDRGAIRRLLGLLLAGDAPGALAALRDQYDLGVEPSAVLRGLLESVHGITRAKVGGPGDPAQSSEEREAYGEWASHLSHAAVHRLWQLLLKGLGEVNSAPMPFEAAEMALLRVIHAAELPDPAALMEKLASGEAVSARPTAAPAAPQQGALMKAPETFAGLVDLLAARGKAHLAQQLHDYCGLVRYAPPELVIRPAKPLSGDLARELAGALKAITETLWKVQVSDEPAQPTLLDQEKQEAERLRQSVLEAPLVKAAFEAFPDAELAGYRLDDQRSA
ncbi:MAG: DNA polymerase III subunit gamma/tau [Alphaproteobacteria bacterium]|nr:DNA polymerase III subunit gamma/tau [Alphaproteobacteria bacterium]MBV9370227.1 DNA polymerase III subunit gamma/tau [Alphaproteobacteria bacterium]MBV9899712.1 DNA polymerase III subunit gamma/tau [Alphaproteobacteria bacterium]